MIRMISKHEDPGTLCIGESGERVNIRKQDVHIYSSTDNGDDTDFDVPTLL